MQNVAEDNSVTDIQPFPPSFFFLFIKLHKPEYRRRKKWLLSAVWMSLHLPDWTLLHQINMRTFANTILLWYNRDTCKSLPVVSLLIPGSSWGFFIGHLSCSRIKKKKKKGCDILYNSFKELYAGFSSNKNVYNHANVKSHGTLNECRGVCACRDLALCLHLLIIMCSCMFRGIGLLPVTLPITARCRHSMNVVTRVKSRSCFSLLYSECQKLQVCVSVWPRAGLR